MFEFPKGEQRLSFLSSLAAATSPLYLNRRCLLFSFFFFFPLPSLSRKRDKHERAGIDLSEALHEHQQRSRNKSKRVEDPPKRAPPSRYKLSPTGAFLAEPFCLF